MDFPKAKTVIEPFKVKVVEPIPFVSPAKRNSLLQKVAYNLFKLPADTITFDLLTDSGTSAMSATQWSALMLGDESYAGSRSYYKFEAVVSELTGMEYVIPTHQGRSAEALLMPIMLKPGQTVIGNTHFDTTRANIEAQKANALDLPTHNPSFKGDIDLDGLGKQLQENAHNTPMVIMTVTNNAVGGQPVSMENLHKVQELVKTHNSLLFLDAARFAENAYFIKKMEKAYGNRSIKSIAQEMFSLADGVLMSAKKDAFGNIGGFLALRDQGLAEEVRSVMVITEGFPSYGGLAGRDLEALAVGLQEILEESYLAYRIRSVEYFSDGVAAAGFKVIKPSGGHAVYIDAGKSLPHIPWYRFPGQSLSIALYEHIGIRSVEVGSVMFGKFDPVSGKDSPAPFELLRLAMPRRVYTQSHVDYMLEMMTYLSPYSAQLPGYEILYQPKVLRHFTAEFRPITN